MRLPLAFFLACLKGIGDPLQYGFLHQFHDILISLVFELHFFVLTSRVCIVCVSFVVAQDFFWQKLLDGTRGDSVGFIQVDVGIK